MCLDHLDEACAAILGASATLMSVCIGIVAVVPAALELLRSRNLEHFQSMEVRRNIGRDLSLIGHTIWIFVLAQLLCAVGVVTSGNLVAISAFIVWFIGLAMMLAGGFHLARLALKTIS